MSNGHFLPPIRQKTRHKCKLPWMWFKRLYTRWRCDCGNTYMLEPLLDYGTTWKLIMVEGKQRCARCITCYIDGSRWAEAAVGCPRCLGTGEEPGQFVRVPEF